MQTLPEQLNSLSNHSPMDTEPIANRKLTQFDLNEDSDSEIVPRATAIAEYNSMESIQARKQNLVRELLALMIYDESFSNEEFDKFLLDCVEEKSITQDEMLLAQADRTIALARRAVDAKHNAKYAKPAHETFQQMKDQIMVETINNAVYSAAKASEDQYMRSNIIMQRIVYLIMLILVVLLIIIAYQAEQRRIMQEDNSNQLQLAVETFTAELDKARALIAASKAPVYTTDLVIVQPPEPNWLAKIASVAWGYMCSMASRVMQSITSAIF